MTIQTPIALKSLELRVGLSWDPNQVVTAVDRVKSLMGRNTVTFDLDIACYVYGRDGTFQDYISGLNDEMAGKSGCINHSGDNTDGVGDGDDEFITLDLKNAPDYLHTLIFVVEVASAHAFQDIIQPSAQVFNQTLASTVYKCNLAPEGYANSSACVTCKITRHSEGKWVLSPLEDFLDHENVEDWSSYLKKYLN